MSALVVDGPIEKNGMSDQDGRPDVDDAGANGQSHVGQLARNLHTESKHTPSVR